MVACFKIQIDCDEFVSFLEVKVKLHVIIKLKVFMERDRGLKFVNIGTYFIL